MLSHALFIVKSERAKIFFSLVILFELHLLNITVKAIAIIIEQWQAIFLKYVSQNQGFCAVFISCAQSDSLPPQGLYLARLLCPWDYPGKNAGGACHFLFPGKGTFPTQRSNPRFLHLLHWQHILYH